MKVENYKYIVLFLFYKSDYLHKHRTIPLIKDITYKNLVLSR